MSEFLETFFVQAMMITAVGAGILMISAFWVAVFFLARGLITGKWS